MGIIVLSLVARDAFRSAEQQADARATTLAAIAEQDIRRNLELLDVSLLATMARLELPASPDSAALRHDRALFENLPRDQYNFFTEALDQKGDVIAGSPPPPSEHGENWAGTEYFTTLRLASSVGSFIGRPIATAHGNNAAIPIGRRIVGPDGNFAGVIVMAVRVAYFHDLLDRLGLDPHDSATVLRDDGTVLMRLPFDQNNLGDKLDASPPFQAFVQYGTTPMTVVDPIDHFERRLVFRRVGSSSLIVSVGLANDAIHANALAVC
jgi:hypothetical protein